MRLKRMATLNKQGEECFSISTSRGEIDSSEGKLLIQYSYRSNGRVLKKEQSAWITKMDDGRKYTERSRGKWKLSKRWDNELKLAHQLGTYQPFADTEVKAFKAKGFNAWVIFPKTRKPE